MFLMRCECAAMASRVYDKNARLVEGGRFATESPGRHSVAGRIGRGTKPPPQFGQTLKSMLSTQSAQNVHSYEQIRAIVDAGGRSLSQHSQFGRSSSAIAPTFRRGYDEAVAPRICRKPELRQTQPHPLTEGCCANVGPVCGFSPFRCALISLNLDSARSNLSLKSHIASRISPKVADVFALSARPKVKMLLLRKNPMIVGSEILYAAKLPDLRAALVGLGIIWMSSKSFI